MIGSISKGSSVCEVQNPQSKEVVVDDAFISKLREKFDNDNIPDPVQACKGKSLEEMMGAPTILGFDISGAMITGEDMERSIKQDFNSFRSMFYYALDEAGISKEPAFEVKEGASGRLYIDSDHPDKEKIEKILNETPNISSAFSRMSANSSLIAALKRGIAFNKAYEIDPKEAVQKYRYLFEEEPCDIFSIFVSKDEYKPNLISYGKEENLKVFEDIINDQNNK